jgi:membrane-bound serine protease (ClpP class)
MVCMIVLAVGIILLIVALFMASILVQTSSIRDIMTISTFLLIPFIGLFGFVTYKAYKTTKINRMFTKYPAGIGRAIDDISPDKEGYVVISGEYWKAKSSIFIKAGSEIIVVGHHNNISRILSVEPTRGEHMNLSK